MKPELSINSDNILLIDARAEHPGAVPLLRLWSGEFAAIRLTGLVSQEACRSFTNKLLDGEQTSQHLDIPGLNVLGFSHFQVARDHQLAEEYASQFRRLPSVLRRLSFPYSSPFDVIFGWLSIAWPSGCRVLQTLTGSHLSPFTIRIYGDGIGIEPHLDVVATELQSEPVADDIRFQFGVNLYLDLPNAGGELELFHAAFPDLSYTEIASGPKTWSTQDLPSPVRIRPNVAEVIIFPSHRLHAVSPSIGPGNRVTLSFFIGLSSWDDPVWIWA
jgi:hypothetical protein